MSDIQRLFQEDPEKLTKEDLKPMVAYYREKRAQFMLGDKMAGATKKLKGDKPIPSVKIDNIDELLKDL